MPYKTMAEVRAGYPLWFEPGAMRFFGSKIESSLLKGEFFITSECCGAGHPRLFSVRRATAEGIATIGECQAYKTKADARDAVKELQKGASNA